MQKTPENMGQLRCGGPAETSKASLERMWDELTTIVEQVDPQTSPDRAETQFDPDRSVEHVVSVLNQLKLGDSSSQSTIIRDLAQIFSKDSDLVLRTAQMLDVGQRAFLYEILRQARIDDPAIKPHVFAFRSRANVFGWNATSKAVSGDAAFTALDTGGVKMIDETAAKQALLKFVLRGEPPDLVSVPEDDRERKASIFLDGEFSGSFTGTMVAIARPKGSTQTQPVIGFIPTPYYSARGNHPSSQRLRDEKHDHFTDPRLWLVESKNRCAERDRGI